MMCSLYFNKEKCLHLLGKVSTLGFCFPSILFTLILLFVILERMVK